MTSKTYLSISNAFASIMLNMPEGIKATNTALDSQGSAMKEQSAYMNSIKAKMNELKETSVGFWNTLISSEAIKGLVSMGTSAIKLLDGLTKTFGGMPVIIGVATMSLLTFNKGFRAMFVTVDEHNKKLYPLLDKLKLVKQEINNIGNASGLVGKTTASFSALKNILSATGIAALAMNAAITVGISVAITYLTKLISSAKETKKELADAIGEVPAKTQEVIAQQTMIRTLDQLSAKKGRSKEEDMKLLEVQKELGKLYPQVADGVDAEGNALVTNTKLVKEQLAEKMKLIKIENEGLAAKAKDELPKMEAEIKSREEKIKRLDKRIADQSKITPKTATGADRASINEINTLASLQKARQKETKNLKDVTQEKNKLAAASNSFSQASQMEIKNIINESKAFKDGKMSASQLTEELKKQGYEEKDIAAAIEEHSKATDENTGKKKENTAALKDNNEALQEGTSEFKAASGEIDFLNGVIEEYNKNSSLSAKTITEMAEKYPQYLALLKDEPHFIDNITKARDNSTKNQEQALQTMLQNVGDARQGEVKMANDTANAVSQAGAQAVNNNGKSYMTDALNFLSGENSKKQNANSTGNAVTNTFADVVNKNAFNYRADGSNFANNENGKIGNANNSKGAIVSCFGTMVNNNANNYKIDAQNFAKVQNSKIDAAQQAANAISWLYGGLISSVSSEMAALHNSVQNTKDQMASGAKADVFYDKPSSDSVFGGYKPTINVPKVNHVSISTPDLQSGTTGGTKGGKNGTTGGTTGTGTGSDSGSKEKDVENLELEYDRYKKINDELSQYDYWINKVSSDKESAKTDGEKVKLLSQEVEWLNKKKIKLEELRKEQESEEKGLAWDLTQNGFDIKWTEDMDGQWNVVISNMNERLQQLVSSANSLTGKAKEDAIKKVKELEEEVKKYSDLTVNKMADSSKAWQDNAKAISDTNKEMEDLVKNKMKDYIEKQKEADYMEQEEKHKKENIELEKSIYEVSKEQFEAYKTSKINGINEEIAKLHDKLLVEAENIDTQDALKAKFEELKMIQDEQFDKIKNYQEVYEKTYKERIENLDKEIKILDDKYEAELKAEEDAENKAKEEEERANRLKDIADSQKEINELEKQLINLRKEKNIRTLTKDEDGKFQWDWDYNKQEYEKVQEDIDKKQEDIDKKQKEMAKWEQDLVKQKEKKKKEEEFKAQKDKLANEKKYLEEVLRIQKEKYDQEKKILDEKQQAEKDLLDAHYKDVEKLTDEWLNELKQTYGENWSQMSIIVDEKVTTMEKRIKEMIDAINLANQAVAGLGSGQSGITSDMIKIGGKVLTAEEKYLADNPDVKAMLQSGNAPFTSGKQHYELWGKDEGRSWGTTSITPPINSPWKSVDYGGNQIGRGVMPPSFVQSSYSAPTLHQDKGDSININGNINLPSVKTGSDFISEVQGLTQQAKQRFR